MTLFGTIDHICICTHLGSEHKQLSIDAWATDPYACTKCGCGEFKKPPQQHVMCTCGHPLSVHKLEEGDEPRVLQRCTSPDCKCENWTFDVTYQPPPVQTVTKIKIGEAETVLPTHLARAIGAESKASVGASGYVRPRVTLLGVSLGGPSSFQTKSSSQDEVNHPSHYGGADNIYETIKVIEAWNLNFNVGNAVKYLSRAGKKDPSKLVEDLEKAKFYLQREIDKLKNSTP